MSVPSARRRLIRPLRRDSPWRQLRARSAITEVEGFPVHSVELGSGKPPLVLLHGLAGSTAWWSRNAEALARDHRVLIPDLIGFGQTPRAGELPGIDRAADLLVHWLDRLELAQVALVGHSMGGQIATHLTARYADRVDRLVLVDSAGIPRPLRPRALALSALAMAPPAAWGDRRFLWTIAADAWVAGPRTLTRAIREILSDDVRPLLSQIRAPTLIIWGERDRLVPIQHARAFHAGIPNSHLLVLRGAAHNPMVDRPVAFNEAVLRFLRSDPRP